MKNNILRINETFSYRLKKRSAELGYNTEPKLCEAIQAAYPDVSSSAVHSWWSYVSIPGYENMIRIADFLDCDINYLLGLKEESTFDRSYIHRETGLSDMAIRILQNSPEITCGGLLQMNFKPMVVVINYLLTNSHGQELLQHLYNYLNSNELIVKYKGEKIIEDVIVENSNGSNTYHFSPSDYETLILSQIQKELVLIKNSQLDELL